MFGMPLEVILTLAGGIGGFIMKNIAQNRANQYELFKLSLQQQQVDNDNANDASKRGSPTARKVIAFIIIGVVFLGVFTMGFFDTIDTTLIIDKAQHSFLGLKWGKTYEVVSSTGFLIPPWFKYCVITVVSFYLGTGASKISK